ncbi:formimidoylglutamase [Algoriphagus winogradskyi]|jgi:formiminoglutamase|uniref:Formimidoylglutamase n=1 Tax=Algoriphagus winogradskyi TaxID=237017 RepID=A0ABY1NZZ8_9BACT|nr:formimidoylglutamase [Algoriphagus winogradskyi]SMP23093.1 formiminoglutamase [Algoriphagus winogradskyi]
MLHQNPNPSLWSGRKSETIEYWHQAAIAIKDLKLDEDQLTPKVGILGYAGEEGVKRNQGRLGTAEGPNAIRKGLGTLAFHLPERSRIFDYGDVYTEDSDMESSHELITKTVFNLLETKHFPILLGGGHDLALAHGRGVFQHLASKNQKLGIINMDAHFDLRPTLEGKGHSGSPFFQLAEENPGSFQYLCLGVQRSVNPKSLFNTAERIGAKWMVMEDFRMNNWEVIQEKILWFLDSVDKIYLSVDMDGFSSAFAPGVSAPSPMGFRPEFAFKVFELLASSKKLISMDVVELNPAFDHDQATSRLAARCAEYVARKVLAIRS